LQGNSPYLIRYLVLCLWEIIDNILNERIEDSHQMSVYDLIRDAENMCQQGSLYTYEVRAIRILLELHEKGNLTEATDNMLVVYRQTLSFLDQQELSPYLQRIRKVLIELLMKNQENEKEQTRRLVLFQINSLELSHGGHNTHPELIKK